MLTYHLPEGDKGEFYFKKFGCHSFKSDNHPKYWEIPNSKIPEKPQTDTSFIEEELLFSGDAVSFTFFNSIAIFTSSCCLSCFLLEGTETGPPRNLIGPSAIGGFTCFCRKRELDWSSFSR